MISESSSQNQSLSQALYESALKRLSASLTGEIGADMLAPCQFGVAPGADRRHMLFVVAESRSHVERLSSHIETIANGIEHLMPGIARVALCVRPSSSSASEQGAERDRHPRRLAGRIFELPYRANLSDRSA